MSDPSRPIDFTHLSVAERILLAEELWDSVAVEQDAPPLSPEQQAELQRRLAVADRGEMTYSTWQDVKLRHKLWKSNNDSESGNRSDSAAAFPKRRAMRADRKQHHQA